MFSFGTAIFNNFNYYVKVYTTPSILLRNKKIMAINYVLSVFLYVPSFFQSTIERIEVLLDCSRLSTMIQTD